MTKKKKKSKNKKIQMMKEKIKTMNVKGEKTK